MTPLFRLGKPPCSYQLFPGPGERGQALYEGTRDNGRLISQDLPPWGLLVLAALADSLGGRSPRVTPSVGVTSACPRPPPNAAAAQPVPCLSFLPSGPAGGRGPGPGMG